MRIIKHLILWDGDCGFCRRTVAWIKRRDRRHCFEAMAYQQAPSPPMTPALYANCSQAVHVVQADGTILRAGRAALFILGKIGWYPLAHLLSLPPLIWIVELGYRVVANNRSLLSRFFFRNE